MSCTHCHITTTTWLLTGR